MSPHPLLPAPPPPASQKASTGSNRLEQIEIIRDTHFSDLRIGPPGGQEIHPCHTYYKPWTLRWPINPVLLSHILRRRPSNVTRVVQGLCVVYGARLSKFLIEPQPKRNPVRQLEQHKTNSKPMEGYRIALGILICKI